MVYIFGKKSAKLCTGTQRYNLPVFLYSAFKNKLYSTFIQQKNLKQAPSYTVTFRNNRYLYLSKMQPLHHKKYVSMNIILSQRIYFIIINSETQICKIKVTIENKSLNMKIKKFLKGPSKNLSRAQL